MKKIIYLFMIIMFTSQLAAQSAEEAVDLLSGQQGFGIRAASLGNAYTAVADDYSAVYWNPAGLAQLKTGELYTSLYNLNFNNKSTYLGTKTNQSQDFTKFQSIGMVYPMAVERGSLVFAFGYQKTKDLDSYTEFNGYLASPGSNSLFFDISNDLGDYGQLDFDRDIDQNTIIRSSGNLSQWSFAGAIDLSPQFSTGITLNIISGRNDYNYDYLQTDRDSQNSYDIFLNDQKIEEFYYNSYSLKQNLISEYSGFEAKAGGLFRFNDHIRLGGTITLPKTIHVKETWDVNDELLYDIFVLQEQVTYQYEDKMSIDEGAFDYDIKVPFKFSGGVSYSNDLFLVSASADYCDWTQLKYEVPDDRNSSDYTDLLDENKYFLTDFKSVLSYGAGAEVNLMNGMLSLRGGYKFIPTPLKNVSSKLDRTYYTAGIGLLVDENAVFEASYSLGSWSVPKYYSYYYWDGDDMQTYEKNSTSKIQVGLKLNF